MTADYARGMMRETSPMNPKSYGVLVHGAGWVSTQHMAAFQRNPFTRVLAVSSRKLESARQRAVEAGLTDVPVFDNFQQALRHEGIDIVSICTPQHVHCDNVLAAARAGKHLVIEKPLGISLVELRKMRDAVRQAGVKTVVSFVLRWNPLFRTLKSMMADNALGKLFYVEADYFSQIGSWWSGWSDTCNREQGVSAMIVAGCHAVDALRWFASPGEFTAANAVEVFAVSGGWRKGQSREYNPLTNTWREDAPKMDYDGLELALVRFDNGVIGKVCTNFDCVMPYQFPIRICGDRGSIFDNKIWSHKFPNQNKWVEIPAILPDSSDVGHHPFQGEIDHFVDCLRNNVESHCNLEDAIQTHEIAFAAQQCYRTRKPVKLPLLKP